MMSQRIVDGLESIKIQEQCGQRRLIAAGMRERLGDAIFEERPIGQTGQAVKIGQSMDLPFGALPFADVLSRSHDRQGLELIVKHRLRLQIDRKIRAVRQDKPMSDIAGLPLAQDPLQSLGHAVLILRMHQLEKCIKSSAEIAGPNAHQPAQFG